MTSYGKVPCFHVPGSFLIEFSPGLSTPASFEESTTTMTITLKTNNQQESRSQDHQLSLPQQSSQHTEGPVPPWTPSI